MLTFGALSEADAPAVQALLESNPGYRPTGRVVPFIDGPVETTVAVWTRPLAD